MGKKTFDRVHPDALLLALRRIGTPQHYIDAIAAIYSQPKFSVIDRNSSHSKPSEFLDLKSGIRQGCPLSPFLFVIFMTVLFEDIDQQYFALNPSRKRSVVDIWDLEYADDTVLIALTHTQLRTLLQLVETEAAFYNMKLNTQM